MESLHNVTKFWLEKLENKTTFGWLEEIGNEPRKSEHWRMSLKVCIWSLIYKFVAQYLDHLENFI